MRDVLSNAEEYLEEAYRKVGSGSAAGKYSSGAGFTMLSKAILDVMPETEALRDRKIISSRASVEALLAAPNKVGRDAACCALLSREVNYLQTLTISWRSDMHHFPINWVAAPRK